MIRPSARADIIAALNSEWLTSRQIHERMVAAGAKWSIHTVITALPDLAGEYQGPVERQPHGLQGKPAFYRRRTAVKPAIALD